MANPRSSLPGPLTAWPQEIATLLQNPRGANDAKAIEAFRRLLEEPNDEVWRQGQALLLSAWQTLNLRQDIPDLNPKILARFFQSGSLALCQSLLTFLKTAKGSFESSIRARLAADLATPVTLENKAHHPGFLWLGARIAGGDFDEALQDLGELAKTSHSGEKSAPQITSLLAAIKEHIQFAKEVRNGQVKATQAVALFAQRALFRGIKGLETSVAPLVYESLSGHVLNWAAQNRDGPMVMDWIRQSSRNSAGSEAQKAAEELWGWLIERVKGRLAARPAEEMEKVAEWARVLGDCSGRKDALYDFWNRLPENPYSDLPFGGADPLQFAHRAFASAKTDEGRIESLKKISKIFLERRMLPQGLETLNKAVEKMEGEQGQARLAELIAQYGREMADLLRQQEMERQENLGRIREGRIRHFRERIAAARDRGDNPENIRALEEALRAEEAQ